MIPIALTQAVILYSLFLGVVMAAIWIYTELNIYRPQRFLTKQFLWRCVFCGYVYLDEAAERISECPRCGSYNSVEDKAARFVPEAHKKEKVERFVHQDEEEPRRNPSRRKRPGQRRRGPRRKR